ncbi:MULTISPECIES: hypothetical protein [Pseudomonas]|uniref:hypothetical protein n=1 Tax=Pseudomonas TaxID=286 RepID=UPI00061B0622|nr:MULTISPECIES: hypothetical protein [Pseudomonas]
MSEPHTRADAATGDAVLHEGARVHGLLLTLFIGSLLALGTFLLIQWLSFPPTMTGKRNHLLIADYLNTGVARHLLQQHFEKCLGGRAV